MTITIDATFKDGTFRLNGPVELPDGTPVRLTITPTVSSSGELSPGESDVEEIPTLYERYESFIGCIDDLPSDMAEQHDHYIHGTPKR